MFVKRLCVVSGLIVAALVMGLMPGGSQLALAQVDASGATELDRDVKLIWANADTSDNLWQSPHLFGSALFLEVGSSNISTRMERTPSTLSATTSSALSDSQGQSISVNQTGYFPDAPKHAVIVSDSVTPLDWRLADSEGSVLLEGKTTPFGKDAASDESLHQIDFTAFTTPGIGYLLQVGESISAPFDLSLDLYSDLKNEALAYFYLNRSGIPIEADYAPGPEWARPAGHLSDGEVTCYKGEDASGKEWPGCDYTLDAAGGWYDAGDYGKYVVNGGISAWTLMNIYERNPQLFPDGSLNLPENQNGVPDVLDEARWELEFLLSMQAPEGETLAGMAHHKLHGKRWDLMPSAPPEKSTATSADGGRSLFPPSTAATLNLAATAAQCARIWETIDPDFSKRCLAAAERAWQAATAYPTITAVAFDAGGGPYDDSNFADEFYWAASELYITTGDEAYRDFLLSSKHFADTRNLYWGATAALGTISLAVAPNELPAEKLEQTRQSVIASGDDFIRTLNQQGYLIPLSMNNYVWGSNSEVLNRMMMMGLAYDFTQDRVYLDGMTESMDYLLGRNPLNKSYVSGYGENPLEHPHHRFWGNQPARGYPAPPPGSVAGGPNSSPSDPAAAAVGLAGQPPAKSYVDAYGSYSTNEVAINWNAPLAWNAAYLDEVGRQAYATAEAKPQSATTTEPSDPAPTGFAASDSVAWFWIVLALLRLAVGIR